MDVRPATDRDRATVVELLRQFWGGGTVVAGHGTLYDAATLPALLAWQGGRAAGLLTYTVEADALEVVTINSVARQSGAGSALLDAAAGLAREAGLARLWLVTTNDNLDAVRFYQRRGLRIAAVVPGGVDESRRLKPSIPLVGEYGIEMHDELILELRLR